MEEEAKAIQETAKLGQEVIKFLSRFIGGSLEQAGGIFEDKLRYMRWERQIRLMDRADQFLKERGLDHPTRPVPLSLIIPLVQGGSLEENDNLQDRWATLLVNAADAGSDIEVRRAFLSILEDLAPFDALVLEKIYSVRSEPASQTDSLVTVWTKHLPDQAIVKSSVGTKEDFLLSPKLEVALANLARLGLIFGIPMLAETTTFAFVHQTMLGQEFVQACSGPHTKHEG